MIRLDPVRVLHTDLGNMIILDATGMTIIVNDERRAIIRMLTGEAEILAQEIIAHFNAGKWKEGEK